MITDSSKIDINKLKPKKVHAEKERLYEDALKLKIQSNSYKSENVKLKTQVKILEREVLSKEDMLQEMFNQKDISTIGSLGKKINKRKFESHLTSNLKRQVRELKATIQDKNGEVDGLKRDIKSTKIQELDLELRTYMDECMRLRHMLEENMRSRDPLADPQQMAEIENQFQQQQEMLQQMSTENQNMILIMQKKDEEIGMLNQMIDEIKPKASKGRANIRENKKLKRQLKEKNREMAHLRQEISLLKSSTDPEMLEKIEKMVASKSQRSSTTKIKKRTTKNKSKVDHLEQQIEDLRDENKEIADQMGDQLKQINDLYTEEREKNEDLLKHLNNTTEKSENKPARTSSARPKSASKYGRKTDSSNVSSQEIQMNVNAQKTEEIIEDEKEEVETQEVTLDAISWNDVSALSTELRMRLQRAAIPAENARDLVEGSSAVVGDLISTLRDQLKFNKDQAQTLARYMVEPDRTGRVKFNPKASCTKNVFVERINEIVSLKGENQPYKIFSAQDERRLKNEVRELLSRCRETLEETVQLDDDEQKGSVSLEGLKESFEVMEIELSPEVEEFLWWFIFRESDDTDEMKYSALFAMLDEVDEDEVPEAEPSEPTASEPKDTGDDYDDGFDDDDKEEELKDNVRDIDDLEEEEDLADSVKNALSQPQSQSIEPQSKGTADLVGSGQPEQDYAEEPVEGEMDDEEGLTIAEDCFKKISDLMKERGLTVKTLFKDVIQTEILQMEDDSEYEIELMSPEGFISGLEQLGIIDLTDKEIQCLMLILAKPELEHAIVVADLQMVMENFEIYDDGQKDNEEDQPQDNIASQPEETDDKDATKKKKYNFDRLSVEALSVLYSIGKWSQDNDLKDLLDERSYEQPVKTKKKENVVEIIKSDDFFALLNEVGLLQNFSNSIQSELEEFLCLDPQYKDLIMIKKVVKTSEHLLRNEDYCTQIIEWRENNQEEESIGEPDFHPKDSGDIDDEIEREMEADLARDKQQKQRQAEADRLARERRQEEEAALAPSDPEPDPVRKESSIEDDIDYAEKFANQQKSEESYGEDFEREEPKPKAKAKAKASKSKDDYSDAFNESDISDEYV